MSKTMSTNVGRSYSLSEKELIKHFGSIGDAIKADADKIASIGCEHISKISISVVIASTTDVTTIAYTIDRYADPRMEVQE